MGEITFFNDFPTSFLWAFVLVSIIISFFSMISGNFESIASSLLFLWLCIGLGKFLIRMFKK